MDFIETIAQRTTIFFINYEQKTMPTKQFTIGVIYKTRGQTKLNDMIQNEPTPQYLKFVDSLGQKNSSEKLDQILR